MTRGIFWDTETGKLILGSCDNQVQYACRYVKAQPNKEIKADNLFFDALETQLRQRGYEPIIYENGTITVTMPKGDKYGWVLREIARAYYYTMKMEAVQ